MERIILFMRNHESAFVSGGEFTGGLKTKTPKTPKTLKLENKDPPYIGGLRNSDQPVANALATRILRLLLASLGPDALDWQNLFRPSKILDKICLCQIFSLSSVGALIHSKIFVNHKFQSHGNKHHRLFFFCFCFLYFISFYKLNLFTKYHYLKLHRIFACSLFAGKVTWDLRIHL